MPEAGDQRKLPGTLDQHATRRDRDHAWTIQSEWAAVVKLPVRAEELFPASHLLHTYRSDCTLPRRDPPVAMRPVVRLPKEPPEAGAPALACHCVSRR